jgi:hypothetical protein
MSYGSMYNGLEIISHYILGTGEKLSVIAIEETPGSL